ncbi:hypothetical protein N7488_008028 [Penicillium malachiteum]|nr:hypothetical protein N7488_008028 [Penicillium malachiteum]
MDYGHTPMKMEATEASREVKQFIIPYSEVKLEEFDTTVASPWDTEEVGYFYPDNWKGKHMESKNHILIFHNAHAFVSHLRALVGFKLENVMRANIQSCLREEALDWFITELNNPERHALRTLPLEQGWFKQLLKRFRMPPRRALYQCQKATLSKRASIDQRIHDLMRDLQAGGIHSTDEQAMYIWRKLVSENYYKDIPRPEKGAPLSKLLQDLHLQSDEQMYTEYEYEDESESDSNRASVENYKELCQRNPEI